MKTLKELRENLDEKGMGLETGVMPPASVRKVRTIARQLSNALQPNIPQVITRIDEELKKYGYTLGDVDMSTEFGETGSEDFAIFAHPDLESVKNLYLTVKWEKTNAVIYRYSPDVLQYSVKVIAHIIDPTEFDDIIGDSLYDYGNVSDEHEMTEAVDQNIIKGAQAVTQLTNLIKKYEMVSVVDKSLPHGGSPASKSKSMVRASSAVAIEKVKNHTKVKEGETFKVTMQLSGGKKETYFMWFWSSKVKESVDLEEAEVGELAIGLTESMKGDVGEGKNLYYIHYKHYKVKANANSLEDAKKLAITYFKVPKGKEQQAGAFRLNATTGAAHTVNESTDLQEAILIKSKPKDLSISRGKQMLTVSKANNKISFMIFEDNGKDAPQYFTVGSGEKEDLIEKLTGFLLDV